MKYIIQEPDLIALTSLLLHFSLGVVGMAGLRTTCDESPEQRSSLNEYFVDDMLSGKVSLPPGNTN